jgi:NADH:ubiquinone oxidoreductase subunit 5 (subunit L)/multisubunit Na+/H+ antiporter MnhA subunit
VLCEFIVVVVGRFTAIFISYYFFEFFFGDPKNKLSPAQITFVVYAALIRGAIAFGLSQELSPSHFGHSDGEHEFEVEVVQTSILMLIILTTVLIGGFTPLMSRCLLGSSDSNEDVAESNVETIDDDTLRLNASDP